MAHALWDIYRPAMIAPVNLTGHELTAASSAVAALAIVGGYLGVRSANRNAVKIAREERSSRRHDELDALKRIAYARCVAALFALNTASIDERSHHAGLAEIRQRIDAALAAHDAVVGIEQIAPDRLFDLACEAMESASGPTDEDATAFVRRTFKLRKAMSYDLRGVDIPSPEELDRMADEALSS
jgi:hypothetical protein